MSVPEHDRLFGTFLLDCARSYLLLRIETDIIQGAVTLLRAYPLRTADAIQLSTAMQLNQALQEAQLGPVIVASADDRLLQAAVSEGLPIANPNSQ